MGLFGRVRCALALIWARAAPSREEGASAVEYGILVSLIAAVVIIAVFFLGTKTSSAFSCTASVISAGSAATNC